MNYFQQMAVKFKICACGVLVCVQTRPEWPVSVLTIACVLLILVFCGTDGNCWLVVVFTLNFLRCSMYFLSDPSFTQEYGCGLGCVRGQSSYVQFFLSDERFGFARVFLSYTHARKKKKKRLDFQPIMLMLYISSTPTGLLRMTKSGCGPKTSFVRVFI